MLRQEMIDLIPRAVFKVINNDADRIIGESTHLGFL